MHISLQGSKCSWGSCRGPKVTQGARLGLRWQRLCCVACVLIPFCHLVLGRCPSGALLGCHDMRLGLGSELEAGPVGKLPRVGEVLASLGLHVGLGDS